MGMCINFIGEGKNENGVFVKKAMFFGKRDERFFDIFSGNDEFDRLVGHAGYPEGATETIYPDANESGHGWFQLGELYEFDWNTVQTKDGVPLASGRTWRQYLAEVLYQDNSDEDDVNDFLNEFTEEFIESNLGVERVLHYLDF